MEATPLIFIGKVISKESPDLNASPFEATSFTFEVIEGYKGCKTGDTIAVSSYTAISTGIEFSIGDTWLMVPYDNNGWHTDICNYGGVIGSDRAKKDLKFLRKYLR